MFAFYNIILMYNYRFIYVNYCNNFIKVLYVQYANLIKTLD